MKMKKVFIVLAVSVLAVLSCAGCQNQGQQSDVNAETELSAVAETVSEESQTVELAPDIEAVDCGGIDYNIIARKAGEDYMFPYSEFLAEDQNGDIINDSVWNRNIFIEEKYNVNIAATEHKDLYTTVASLVKSGDHVYDVVMPMVANAFQMSVNGYLIDVFSLPHVDFSMPWWRGNVMANTSIGHRNFFAVGDLNLASLNGVGVVYFNKRMAEQYNIGDIYQCVRDNNWTIDRFTEYCKGVTKDLDGDGVLDGNDMFGLTCNGFVWQPLFSGFDSRIIEKDSDDIPYLAWDSVKNVSAITKIVSFLNDKGSTILVNQFPELQGAGGWGPASIKMFSEDRALFWIEIIYGVLQLRDMDTDFGLLPMPKYDELQSEYTSYIHPNHTSSCAVPITNTNPDLAGRIIEDMAYQSSLTVRPAYYDTTLKGKVSRDVESGEMLDIIYNKINLDLTLAMTTSGLPIDSTMRSVVIENRTDLNSLIASKREACESTITKTADAILAIK